MDATLTIMPVGTGRTRPDIASAPDLYDTSNKTDGNWRVLAMGSGNYTSPFSPSRMDACGVIRTDG